MADGMTLPQPDESAYTGDIIVRTQTFGKTNRTKVSGLDKVRKTRASLQIEADKRLTIDRLDPASLVSVENQLIINKEISRILNKEILTLSVFTKNNS
jgi:hypothetical protein